MNKREYQKKIMRTNSELEIELQVSTILEFNYYGTLFNVKKNEAMVMH